MRLDQKDVINVINLVTLLNFNTNCLYTIKHIFDLPLPLPASSSRGLTWLSPSFLTLTEFSLNPTKALSPLKRKYLETMLFWFYSSSANLLPPPVLTCQLVASWLVVPLHLEEEAVPLVTCSLPHHPLSIRYVSPLLPSLGDILNRHFLQYFSRLEAEPTEKCLLCF